MTGAGIAGFSTAIFAGDSGNRGSVATAGAGSVTLASLGSTCSEGTTALATGPAVETAGAISIVGAEVATGTSVTGVTAAGFAGTGVTPSDDGMLAGLTAMSLTASTGSRPTVPDGVPLPAATTSVAITGSATLSGTGKASAATSTGGGAGTDTSDDAVTFDGTTLSALAPGAGYQLVRTSK
ncbi:MAG: hypothetical protein EBT47_12675 [Chloroflexi bacterium]|nr:hypothetical protein [Chloroflexota bacterium]